MDGKSPYEYIPAFNASLFLSANQRDVVKAIRAGYPAGTVLPAVVVDNLSDEELRIAFDFDGVVADDESETVYRQQTLDDYLDHERTNSHIPHKPGPLADFLKKLSFMQKLEDKEAEKDREYKRILRIAIVSARNAPAHERMVTTLEAWRPPNETFFLGGVSKRRILDVMKPHVFFDDQMTHFEARREQRADGPRSVWNRQRQRTCGHDDHQKQLIPPLRMAASVGAEMIGRSSSWQSGRQPRLVTSRTCCSSPSTLPIEELQLRLTVKKKEAVV